MCSKNVLDISTVHVNIKRNNLFILINLFTDLLDGTAGENSIGH